MNKKAFFVAGIILAVAIIFPLVSFKMQFDFDLDKILNQGPNLADETQAQSFVNDLDAEHQYILGIVLLVEAVCISLFVISIWFAIR